MIGMTEAHRAYIDVMYMVEGTEVVYVHHLHCSLCLLN